MRDVSTQEKGGTTAGHDSFTDVLKQTSDIGAALSREANLLATSLVKGTINEFRKNPAAATAEVSGSVLAGAALTAVALADLPVISAGIAVGGTVLLAKAAWDAVDPTSRANQQRNSTFDKALTETWNSSDSRRFAKNEQNLEDYMGKAGITAISFAAGGAAASKLGPALSLEVRSGARSLATTCSELSSAAESIPSIVRQASSATRLIPDLAAAGSNGRQLQISESSVLDDYWCAMARHRNGKITVKKIDELGNEITIKDGNAGKVKTTPTQETHWKQRLHDENEKAPQNVLPHKVEGSDQNETVNRLRLYQTQLDKAITNSYEAERLGLRRAQVDQHLKRLDEARSDIDWFKSTSSEALESQYSKCLAEAKQLITDIDGATNNKLRLAQQSKLAHTEPVAELADRHVFPRALDEIQQLSSDFVRIAGNGSTLSKQSLLRACDNLLQAQSAFERGIPSTQEINQQTRDLSIIDERVRELYRGAALNPAGLSSEQQSEIETLNSLTKQAIKSRVKLLMNKPEDYDNALGHAIEPSQGDNTNLNEIAMGQAMAQFVNTGKLDLSGIPGTVQHALMTSSLFRDEAAVADYLEPTNWMMIHLPKGTSADHAKVDYLFVNRETGHYFGLDGTSSVQTSDTFALGNRAALAGKKADASSDRSAFLVCSHPDNFFRLREYAEGQLSGADKRNVDEQIGRALKSLIINQKPFDITTDMLPFTPDHSPEAVTQLRAFQQTLRRFNWLNWAGEVEDGIRYLQKRRQPRQVPELAYLPELQITEAVA